MTMPMSDEQLSRELSGLKDQVVDFRNEMRATMAGFVRQDVYQAQQETLRAQMAKELSDLRGEMVAVKSEANALRGKVEAFDSDKRQNRGLVFGALASAAVALIMGLVNFNK